MIIVDLETTGTDPMKHSVVSIGAVDLDYPLTCAYGHFCSHDKQRNNATDEEQKKQH